MVADRKNMKRGLSLIDMIIAIGIFAFGMQVFTLVLIKVWNNNSFIVEEGETSMIASRMVNETVRNIRKARQADNGSYPVRSGDDYNFTLYLDLDNDGNTERVHYFLEDEIFKVGITNPTGTPAIYAEGDQEIRNLTNYVVNDYLNEPVFTYYNQDYPGGAGENPLDTPINPGDVRLVKVHLFINIRADKAPDHISIESVAELRNLNDYAQF
jgi:hypothetical protein